MNATRTSTAAALAGLALLAGLAITPVLSNLGPWRAVETDVLPVAGEFRIEMLDGQPLSSEELRGELVVLDFWATWCGPCLAEIDDFNGLEALYGDRVRILGITMQSGAADEIAAFARQRRIEYPLAVGGDEIFRDFGPMWGYPTTFLVDRDWRVRHVWVGAGPGKHEQLRKLIGELLGDDIP